MKEMVCLVTGANAGIGYVTARDLAKTGATTVLLCRDEQRGQAARDGISAETGNDSVSMLLCDLSSQASIRQAAEAFARKHDALHVLVNNAAMHTEERRLTVDGIETQFATNYLSYFLLTRLLLDTLEASAPARIINLSTANHHEVSLDLDDLQSEKSYDPKPVHMRSKLAVILFTFELARRLQGTGVTANCLHPGVIATNLLGQIRRIPDHQRFTEVMGGAPLDEGAKTPLYLATSPEVEGVSGEYFEDLRPARSSDATRDEDLARELWQISSKLTGLAA
ncbi:MAG: SDR family oxidoreductase [Woeseiaceae bacterium]